MGCTRSVMTAIVAVARPIYVHSSLREPQYLAGHMEKSR